MFPDVAEGLSLGHLSRGDVTSSLVAGEWYMKNQHFPGWGRPYEFCADLYRKVEMGVAGGGKGGRRGRRSVHRPGCVMRVLGIVL